MKRLGKISPFVGTAVPESSRRIGLNDIGINNPDSYGDSGYHYDSKYFSQILVTAHQELSLTSIEVPPQLYRRRIWVTVSCTAPAVHVYAFLRFYRNKKVVGEYMKSHRIPTEDVYIDAFSTRPILAGQAFRSGPNSVLFTTNSHSINVGVPHELGIFCDKVELIAEGLVEQANGTIDVCAGMLIVQSELPLSSLI